MDHGGAEDVEVGHEPSGEGDRFIDCERLKNGSQIFRADAPLFT
jgi:hypothetical protein